jgi:hypothetical protein
MLAVIIVVICAFDFVDLAVFDENIGFFAEQLFEDFRHLVQSVCDLGFSTNTSLYILKVAVYGL